MALARTPERSRPIQDAYGVVLRRVAGAPTPGASHGSGARRAARLAGYALIAGGVALPIVRRRLRLHPAAVLGGASLAPLAAAVVWPRGRRRDVAVCVLQMYVYLAAYKMPNDDAHGARGARASRLPDRARPPPRRGRVADGAPAARAAPRRPLQRRGEGARLGRTGPGSRRRTSRSLYVRARNPRRFRRAAVLTYAVFDLGAVIYWLFADRAALVCRRAGAACGSATRPRSCAPADGRVRRALLARRWPRFTACVGATRSRRCLRCTSRPRRWRALLLAESGPARRRGRRRYAGAAWLCPRLPRRALRRRLDRRPRADARRARGRRARRPVRRPLDRRGSPLQTGSAARHRPARPAPRARAACRRGHPSYTIKSKVLSRVESRRCRPPRERDHHRQRARRLHGRAVRGARRARAARDRGLRLGRPAPADDRRRELPRLPRGSPAPR